MNSTVTKFGYPNTLIHEYQHWVVLLRPMQVTLGSLILAAKSEAQNFHELPAEAFVELKSVISDIEQTLARATGYTRLNYLMLMMVDPHVHYHVIPRYDGERQFEGLPFQDLSWPGPPDLTRVTQTTADQHNALVKHLAAQWP